jgi:acetyl-CoA C-acetyltransferase
MFGAQSILLGDNDIVVAGGMESMSKAPHYLPSMRQGIRYGNGEILDAIVRDGLQDPFDGSMMGSCGEVCAEGKNISKQAQDEYAMASYLRAREAYQKGLFQDELIEVGVPQPKKDPILVKQDEEVFNSRITDLASVQSARAVFKKDGTITAVNASKINDGAAAMVLMSGEQVKALGIKPLAKIVSYADAAQQPVWFTTAPALAMPKALKKAGLSLNDIDAFEINEAFAVVVLANMQELGLPHDKVNILGGAVALGHPIGMSGARIIMTLIAALRHKGGRYGMASICNGGGGASAVIIELV